MKTQNLKKLALLCVGILIVSCSKSDLSEVDENEALVQEKNEVKIVETQENKDFIVIGLAPGIYGDSNVDAYESATYSYILTQTELNTVPSSLRRFRVRFQVWSGGSWKHKKTYNNQPSTVTAKFPTHGNGNSAIWRIGFQMYNKNTGTSYSKKWKTVVVNN
ncbi:hypothetical protein U6A24_20230 [Aquimarina gracilis]|uniref:Uncharacterized protein n=1 Tax=Aquimarina gracilis TaxID=874422 RepID=A0ABU6A124_9FLAO|nr:hypothetical protein [Aquimarina gracilis]MEB3347816.1 hypothetical protein [Aquimarina gracilis]